MFETCVCPDKGKDRPSQQLFALGGWRGDPHAGERKRARTLISSLQRTDSQTVQAETLVYSACAAVARRNHAHAGRIDRDLLRGERIGSLRIANMHETQTRKIHYGRRMQVANQTDDLSRKSIKAPLLEIFLE